EKRTVTAVHEGLSGHFRLIQIIAVTSFAELLVRQHVYHFMGHSAERRQRMLTEPGGDGNLPVFVGFEGKTERAEQFYGPGETQSEVSRSDNGPVEIAGIAEVKKCLQIIGRNLLFRQQVWRSGDLKGK